MQNKFLAHNNKTREQLLQEIGLSNIKDLFEVIPQKVRMRELSLPEGLSEFLVQKELNKISKKNKNDYMYFLGGGAYNRFVPACINAVASRFEFLSAYTPYQAEISQGTLETIYEFQSLMCNLTNKDVSNASVYDCATGCAEAVLMSVRITKKKKAFISKNLNPNYLEVLKTYLWAHDIEFKIGDVKESDETYACILYQTPDYFGEVQPLPDRFNKTLLIACVNLSTLALLEPPDADIIVGDLQTLGLPLSFGGAWGGVITCKDEYKRQLPGRIVGKSVDKEGQVAYVLTMQAREQHIRREKATSNICSNQALSALCSVLYLNLTGEKDFTELMEISAQNAHKLALGLERKGYKILNKDFVNEFSFEVENADEFLNHMKSKGILAGIKPDKNKILTSTTELNDDEEIQAYIECA